MLSIAFTREQVATPCVVTLGGEGIANEAGKFTYDDNFHLA